MTYLDLVNNVLRRLREEEVSNVSESTFSKMVGDFINDAKKLVENAWDWSMLRNDVTLSTTQGVATYALEGTQDKVKTLSVINDTSNVVIEYRPYDWFEEQVYINGPVSGAPEYYTFNGYDVNNDTQITFYPTPDAAYDIQLKLVYNNDDLSSNTDTLLIPDAPVMHLAIALLARERGETGGTSTPEYFAIADKYLSDAIAYDAQKHPEDTIWYTP